MDPARDESLIFELLDLKHDVEDNGSAAWFLQDLSKEQDGEGFTVTLILLWVYVYLVVVVCYSFWNCVLLDSKD